MSISPEIRDQAYQFFIEEAPELLQVLESGLLTLSQERSTAQVHDLMRAAHSLKGGAASVDLHAIKTIAHRLEDILKALYSDEVVIDTALESLLLQAYDCLRLPLMEQITVGDSNPEFALETAEPIFAQLEAQLGDAMTQAENFIPSSSDLGIDMVLSIFDVDVGQGLERLTVVLANPQDYEVAGELRAQAEVFEGFAELLDLQGFGATAQATLKALDAHPDQAVLITQLALADFQTARDAVLAGDRAAVRGPSVELVALGDSTVAANFDPARAPLPNSVEAAALDWANLEPTPLPVDEVAALEAFDGLLETAPDGWDLPQDLAEKMRLEEREDTEATLDAESFITSLEEGVSADAIPLIVDSFGQSETDLTEISENLLSSPDDIAPEIVSLADQAIAEQLEGRDESCELISQEPFPADSTTHFTLDVANDVANSELEEIFGDLAAADVAAEIETPEGMTDYVDIVIPVNSTVDAESDPTIPSPQAVLDNSEVVVNQEGEPAAPTSLEDLQGDIRLSQNSLAGQEQETENQPSAVSHKTGTWILDSIPGLISHFKLGSQNKSEITDDAEQESAAPSSLEFLDESRIMDDREYEPAAPPPPEFLDEWEIMDDATDHLAAQSPLEVSEDSEILVDWGSVSATPPSQDFVDVSDPLDNVGREPVAPSSPEFLDEWEIPDDGADDLAAQRSQAVLDDSETSDDWESEPTAPPSQDFLDETENRVDDECESLAQIPLETLDEAEIRDDGVGEPTAVRDLEIQDGVEVRDDWGGEPALQTPLEVQDDSQVVDREHEPIAPTSLEVQNESTVLTSLEVLNESAIADHSENPAPVQQPSFPEWTTAPESLVNEADTEGGEDNGELISQINLPLESCAEFTLDAANSELDEIFSDLAVAPEVDEAYEAYEGYEAPAIETPERMTDYVDIIIPDSRVDLESESVAPPSLEVLEESEVADDWGSEPTVSTALEVLDESGVVDVGSEPIAPASLDVLNESEFTDEAGGESAAPPSLDVLNESEFTDEAGGEPIALTFLEVLNESAIADQSENLEPVQQQEFQAQTTAPETLAQAAYSEGGEHKPELMPQNNLPRESWADLTLDTANSELDEMFGDLAAAPEVDEAYEAYEAPEIETKEGITNYVDIIIPADSGVDPGSDPDELAPLDVLNESAIADQAESSAPAQQLELESLVASPETLAEAVSSVEQLFESLPPVDTADTLVSQAGELAISDTSPATKEEEVSAVNALVAPSQAQDTSISFKDRASQPQPEQISAARQSNQAAPAAKLSVKVDLDRLRRMDNQLGELAINRNGLSLQNEQLQRSVRELLHRFVHFQRLTGFLRDLSDQMLIAPERHPSRQSLAPETASKGKTPLTSPASANFDSLELDNYGALHGLLQELLEEVIQLEESVGDIDLFAGQSNQMLEVQRQRMTQLRNELMWARMLPLSGVLNRFPRMLRDLSASHNKPVDLQINGAGVLVDKAVLEKLYTPLLHLLRNAFDHGIEAPETRLQRGKVEQGRIEIRAYHQGNTTVIEVRDDGRGLDLENIGRRAVEMGLLTADQLAAADKKQLSECIFLPGFSTARQVSELSGRGVGLDVVRSQLRSLKGTISVTPSPGQGTTFILRLPLTLTVAKLLISLVGSSALAIPSDSIQEIVIPKASQIKQSGSQRLLYWQNQLVPVYPMAELLDYTYPLPDTLPSKALSSAPTPRNWALPMLIMRQDQTVFALEIERLVTEQELVIKPFSAVIASPSYTFGCTILGDGALVPVIDGAALVEHVLGQSATATLSPPPESASPITPSEDRTSTPGETTAAMQPPVSKTATILVVDDSAALRRTLALTLQKTGYRVLQARDGREALDQLQQHSAIQLIICDIEMPKMNGFEFLSQRRQDPQIKDIPVAMLTSRGNPKHRRLAMHLGANQYFTKPYIEQTFLIEVKNMLEQKKSEAVPALT